MKDMDLTTLEYVKSIIKERPEDVHKGQCGRVLVAAGSLGMAGAAVLAVRSAVRSGAGLVKAVVPDEVLPVLQIAVPEATCLSADSDLSPQFLKDYGAAAIGPGMGVSEDNHLFIKKILHDYKGTVVLDADGLNTLCRYDDGLGLLKGRVSPTILTPHPGEGDRLLKALGEKGIAETSRSEAARTIADCTDTIVLMKGAGTLVTMKEKAIYENTTGNPGMATGGSGDVLTGVIAAIAASGIDAFDAARAGAFIHGMAGDIAADARGQWGMSSADIADALPAAFKTVVGK